MVIKLIANPTAGRGGKDIILQVRAYLRLRGATVHLYETSKRGCPSGSKGCSLPKC